MKLKDMVKKYDYYREKFGKWSASQVDMGTGMAAYVLQNPEHKVEKVALYRDDNNAFVYGDYGQFTFDSLTWNISPTNIPYNNIGYLLEKMGSKQKEVITVFDSEICMKDVKAWLDDRIETNIPRETREALMEFLDESDWNSEAFEITDEYQELADYRDEIQFALDAMGRMGSREEWLVFLRENVHRLDKIEGDGYESDLWSAGKHLNERFFISLVALEVLGEKLEKEKERQDSTKECEDLEDLE